MSSTIPEIKYVDLASSKVKVFYRELGAAPTNKPVLLLLHGFPSSSHQYRNLIPLLSEKFRVIAPDLPGFGFTEAPSDFRYTFENLAKVVAEFVDTISLSRFSIYIFDYGAPVGLRLAIERPQSIEAIISQNGNAYEEGLGDFWDPVRNFWVNDTPQVREQLAKALLTFEATKWQYDEGTADVTKLAPESYYLDYSLLQRPGNEKIQLDLFKDYANNVKLYPKFHDYFRQSKVPLLAVWGKHDKIFIPPGANAFKKDLPLAKVILLDAGHMAVESNTKEIAEEILSFF